ncbi:hypothetical protein C7S16_0467 [Burkholderia thailandensis]|uniref:Uncharacterized protein n=1 Tax=Burkholderia thailandensis TaxID=57975 RepID=A0AAW9D2J5_BURTH|nr:hypothetical protein [Burkholderia thailandensis]MDW9254471.1 hypothetical protein [Burkholderia thailandensis]
MANPLSRIRRVVDLMFPDTPPRKRRHRNARTAASAAPAPMRPDARGTCRRASHRAGAGRHCVVHTAERPETCRRDSASAANAR